MIFSACLFYRKEKKALLCNRIVLNLMKKVYLCKTKTPFTFFVYVIANKNWSGCDRVELDCIWLVDSEANSAEHGDKFKHNAVCLLKAIIFQSLERITILVHTERRRRCLLPQKTLKLAVLLKIALYASFLYLLRLFYEVSSLVTPLQGRSPWKTLFPAECFRKCFRKCFLPVLLSLFLVPVWVP